MSFHQRYAQGIVFVPDGRVLAIKNRRLNTSWNCSVSTVIHRPEISVLKALKTRLKEFLGMDCEKLDGQIGSLHTLSPLANHTTPARYSIAFYVDQSVFELKINSEFIVKAFTMRYILDKLASQEGRYDFCFETEVVFNRLHSYGWHRMRGV